MLEITVLSPHISSTTDLQNFFLSDIHLKFILVCMGIFSIKYVLGGKMGN